MDVQGYMTHLPGPIDEILLYCALREGRHAPKRAQESILHGASSTFLPPPVYPRPSLLAQHAPVTPNPARRDKIDRSPRLKQQISFAAQPTNWGESLPPPPAGQDRE